jgi:hypothetical protein
MLSIQVSLKNKDFVNRFIAKYPAVIEKAVKDTAAFAKIQIMRATPVKTGYTRRNWLIERISEFVYRVTNDFPHANYLEWGTGLYGPKKHLIKPLFAKVLRWPVATRNTFKGYMFAPSVKGFKPFYMVRKNLVDIMNQLKKNLKNNIQRVWGAARESGVV